MELTSFQSRIHHFLPTLSLSYQQVEELFHHFELLRRWNERMDLTSIDSAEEIVSRHYCESLFFTAHLPEDHPGLSILDFGSGAGFPGFPMAVIRPDWRITLLEANQRRAVFLKEAARGLPNVTVAPQRGEKFAQRHDWIVARAVKAGDVLKCIPRIGSKIGLLVGEASLVELSSTNRCRWNPTVRIPWSESRCCAFAECST